MTNKKVLERAIVALKDAERYSGFIGCYAETISGLEDIIANLCPKDECMDKTQCWEPCGDLGHSEEHCKAVDPLITLTNWREVIEQLREAD